jgi:cytochrome c oxidase assembly protein subunit 15
LALVTAGGLVTSNDAALAVPDWPLNWGRLVPPLEGGIRFEFAHRVLALMVAVLTAWLALWMAKREPRRWMRRLAWWAFAAVIAQALLLELVVHKAPALSSITQTAGEPYPPFAASHSILARAPRPLA